MISTHSSHTIRRILLCVGFVVGLSFVALFCFYHLGYDELNSYDEARHGVSAYEMLQTGDPILTTWQYEPDYWNLKPPLSEWLIILGYKLFGCNAVGLRFYSAFAMFLTALFSALYLWQNYSALASVFALFLFPTFGKLFSYHCARTADADALFIFFYVVSILCICKSRQNFRWVYLSCLCFSFAFLTKSFHAGLIAFFVLCALFLLGHFKTMQLKQYLLCALCSVGPVGGWAAARYTKDGMAFLAPMFLQDVVNRSANAIEGHSEPWYFYPGVLFKSNPILLPILLFLVLIGFFLYIRKAKASFFSSDFFLFALGILIPLVVFTLAKTKLVNYIYCIYPLICLLAGVSLTLVTENCTRTVRIVTLVLCFVLSFFSIQKNFRSIIPATDQHDSSLQNVLTLSPLQSKDRVYIVHDVLSYGVGDDWTQAQIMEAEWLTDCIPQSGGIAAFESDHDSYLIAANSLVGDLSSYKVVCQTNAYSILYNP